ncbi:acyltransferase family protein [Stenotrophomonas rhizophila]|uniref:acyltransferase family protein n=1 Tax=Stenotrophomonas rhizophila TaxID=216778 RepID=UPI000B83995F|nr:acyltransferase family protein [Stenotrophomonas rhizophila]
MSLPQNRPGYRPDIDGLRAIAVLAVVVFHLNKSWLPGGFTGVDVFFVISGFLITGILSRGLQSGTFSYAGFYLARARRILPATIFCIAVTLLVGSVVMLPQDAASLGASAAASSVWAANIYFWRALDTGYFATSSELVPLLHLWSLAVEEQFYLFWPPLLAAAYRWLPASARYVLVGGLALGSFQLGQALIHSHPSFAYYMLPTRAGELMVGGLAYWLTTDIKKIPSVLGFLASLVGVALVGLSIVSLDESSGFPGYAALLPTLGTALLLYTGSVDRTLVAAVLSFPGLVAIGRVSFSLYLWHWPVMAFYRYAYGTPSIGGYIACVVAMVAMTLISYFAVERRFRTGSKRSSKLAILGYPAASMMIAGLGYFVFASGGAVSVFKPTAYASNLAKLDGETKPASEYPYNCQIGGFDEAVFSDRRCLLGDTSEAAGILLWGDSHAAHHVGYVKVLAEHNKLAVRNVSMSGCMPVFKTSAAYAHPSIVEACSKFNDHMEQEVEKYSTVVVGSAWVGFDRGNSREDIARTIATLSAKVPHVVIALSVPLFPDYDRECERKSLMFPGLHCKTERPLSQGLENDVNNYLTELAGRYPNVTVLDLHPLLCDRQSCRTVSDGRPVYYDAGHLSMAGSRALGYKAIALGETPSFIDRDRLSEHNHAAIDDSAPRSAD